MAAIGWVWCQLKHAQRNVQGMLKKINKVEREQSLSVYLYFCHRKKRGRKTL